MKKKLLIIFFLSSFLATSQEYKKMIDNGNFTIKEIQLSADKFFEKKGKGKGTGYKQYKRWEYFAIKQKDERGYVKDPSFLFTEWENYNKKRNKEYQNRVVNTGDNWTELGPTSWNETSGWNSGVGRISGFSVEGNNEDHIIVGSIGGGLWKTTNRGTNWTPLTDNHGNMYVYSLTIDPNLNTTYYWGSSSGRIYKSTNSGSTWSAIANAGGSSILKIQVHPTNSDIVFACSRYSGLYRSTNGGTSWTQVLSDYSYDVEFDPNNSNIVFASGDKVHKSTDNGVNFTEITGFSNGAKMIGVSKADSNKVYIVEADGGKFGAFYKSTDNGVSFTKVDHGNKNYFGYESDASDTRGQAPRDMGITVSPTNADEVHIAGINTWKSTDAGTNFSITSQWVPSSASSQNIGYCHADVDDIEFIGGKFYVISDGGIFVCEDTSTVTKDYYKDLTTGLGIRQFYLMGISQTNPVVISAGAQDNGSSVLRSDGTWADWLGADGFESIVDVNDSNILYGTIYNGNMYKSTDQGTTGSGVTRPEETGWVTPLEQDKDGALYFGGSKVYKSIDGATTWNEISQSFGNFTNQVKIASSNTKIIYASVDDKLYKAVNGGELSGGVGNEVWNAVTGFSGSINSLSIHPTDPNKVAVAVTGASEKVYITTDGGTTWTAKSTGLPSFTAYAIVWDNNGKDGLYLGMDYGIYYIDNDATEWKLFNNKLPNVKITELEINYVDEHLYASTYGRGIWKSPRFGSTLSVENHELLSLTVYPNPATNEVAIKWNKQDKVSVRVFNVNGQLLYFNKSTSLNNPLKINTSNLTSGVYFVKINSSKGSYTKKLVVK